MHCDNTKLWYLVDKFLTTGHKCCKTATKLLFKKKNKNLKDHGVDMPHKWICSTHTYWILICFSQIEKQKHRRWVEEGTSPHQSVHWKCFSWNLEETFWIFPGRRTALQTLMQNVYKSSMETEYFLSVSGRRINTLQGIIMICEEAKGDFCTYKLNLSLKNYNSRYMFKSFSIQMATPSLPPYDGLLLQT